MGRETVMTPVIWPEGEFPIFTPVSGEESGWQFPPRNLNVDGEGSVSSYKIALARLL